MEYIDWCAKSLDYSKSNSKHLRSLIFLPTSNSCNVIVRYFLNPMKFGGNILHIHALQNALKNINSFRNPEYL